MMERKMCWLGREITYSLGVSRLAGNMEKYGVLDIVLFCQVDGGGVCVRRLLAACVGVGLRSALAALALAFCYGERRYK